MILAREDAFVPDFQDTFPNLLQASRVQIYPLNTEYILRGNRYKYVRAGAAIGSRSVARYSADPSIGVEGIPESGDLGGVHPGAAGLFFFAGVTVGPIASEAYGWICTYGFTEVRALAAADRGSVLEAAAGGQVTVHGGADEMIGRAVTDATSNGDIIVMRVNAT